MDGPICMGASTEAENGNGLNDCQNGAKFEPAIAIYNRYYGGSCRYKKRTKKKKESKLKEKEND